MLSHLQQLIFSGNLVEEFVIELLVAEAVFCRHLNRRRKFAARVAVAVFLIIAVSFYWPYKDSFMEVSRTVRIYCIIRYMLLFALTIAGLYRCFQESASTVIFCATGAYAMQHLTFCIDRIIIWLMERHGMKVGQTGYVLLAVAVCLASYLTVDLVFVRRIQREKIEAEKEIYIPALLVLVFTVTVNYFRWNDIACNIYGAIISVLTCWILAGIFKYSRLQQEISSIHQMMALKEEHYRLSRDNIEAINIKCHDLKHQISRIRARNSQDDMDHYLQEVEQNILLYDSIAETGSDVLDVIFTEKKMYCEQNHITMNYMADGAKLNFMDECDLYTLFGNAVDNAVESVMKVNVPEKRTISISVRAKGSFVSIHLDNPYEGELLFRDGVPVTTKTNKTYHGYGLKSIRLIVDKYGGQVSIAAEDGLFNLNILIPVPQT